MSEVANIWPSAPRSELEKKVRAEQFDMAMRLAPLSLIIIMAGTPTMIAQLWRADLALWFSGYFALLSLVVAMAFGQSRRARRLRFRGGPPAGLLRGAEISAALIASLTAGFAICAFPMADQHQRMVLAATYAGLLGAGMTMAPYPRLYFHFLAPLTAGCLVALARVDFSLNVGVIGLLSVYAAFLSFLSIQFSRLIRDRVADRLQLERERAVSALLLKEFEENAHDWMWETNAQGALAHLSDRLAKEIGAAERDWRGVSWLVWLKGMAMGQSEGAVARLAGYLEEQTAFRDCLIEVAAAGQKRWWLISGKPTFRDGVFSGFHGVGADVTDKKRAEDRLSFLALHDGLTNMPNRRNFEKRLAVAETSGAAYAVLALDLDEFKGVNDSFGHAAGDALLKDVSNRLTARLADRGVGARLAGDEFAILVEGETAARRPALETLCGEIIEELQRAFPLDGIAAHIGVSIGVAVAGECDGRDLMRCADLALYRSKAHGKNRFSFFEPAMDEAVEERRALAADLRHALERGEFLLHFQPLVNAATKSVQGFEALLRWRHPRRGFVSPAEFIPLAEETGAIVALGAWTIREACRVAAGWPKPVKIAVNLSPVQFRYSDLPEVVADALRETGLPASRLELELTESAFLEASHQTRSTLRKLRELGVAMSLDDFGTGYSSLSYLRDIPFDKIKIDRCFVQDLPDNPRDLTIVRAVVDIATVMGMAITAEGVETAEQSHCLLQQGCHQLQGFLFSKPATEEEALRMLNAPHWEGGDEAAAQGASRAA